MSREAWNWIIVAVAVVVIIAAHTWSYIADRRAHRDLDEKAEAALSPEQAARRGGL